MNAKADAKHVPSRLANRFLGCADGAGHERLESEFVAAVDARGEQRRLCAVVSVPRVGRSEPSQPSLPAV
jgi:hypothetical protein